MLCMMMHIQGTGKEETNPVTILLSVEKFNAIIIFNYISLFVMYLLFPHYYII